MNIFFIPVANFVLHSLPLNSIGTIEVWIHRLAITFCVGMGFLIISARRRKRGNRSLQSAYRQDPYQNSLHIGKNPEPNVSEISARLNKLEQKIRDLQKHLPVQSTEDTLDAEKNPESEENSIEIAPANQMEDPSPEVHWDIKSQVENEKADVPMERFYLTSPDKNKVFYVPDATSTPHEKTLYYIEDDQLKLYDQAREETMRLAINSLDFVIKNACIILNAKETHHSKIVMVEPGKITKENNDFIVLEKIKVKFE